MNNANGDVRTVLYRVAQEALTNVARHAKASQVEVGIQCLDGIIRMEITDNGQGFEVDGNVVREKEQPSGTPRHAGTRRDDRRHVWRGIRPRPRHHRPRGDPSCESLLQMTFRRMLRPNHRQHPPAMPMNPITVLLAEDHMIVREGLLALLKLEADIQVVGEAENGRQAVAMAGTLQPDVVVMDIAMPLLNGLEATRQILHATPATKVLILSAHSDDAYVERGHGAGRGGLPDQTNRLPRAARGDP